MLDLLGILVSSVALLIVIVRAAQLDRKLPWFAASGVDEPGASRRRSARGS